MPRFRTASLLILLALAACGGDADEPYPPDLVTNFLKSCQVKGTKVGCECAIDRIQRKFTLDEFKAFEARMAKGEAPPELMNAIADCPTS
jgi:hypothetical protein